MDSSLLGVLLSLLAAVGFGLFAVLARPAMLYTGFYLGTLVSMAGSLSTVAVLALLTDAPALFRVDLVALGWFAFIGLMNFSLGRLFNLQSIRYLGVSRSASLIGATPLAAALLALLVYGEGISLLLALGTLSVVAGVVLILREAG